MDGWKEETGSYDLLHLPSDPAKWQEVYEEGFALR